MSNHTHHTTQAVKYGRFACFYSFSIIKMKARITEKQARECVSFAFGYCEIQALLRNWNPVFYTASNIYGWKSDIYNIDGIYISTGYWPVGKSIPYKVYKKYEQKADKIRGDYDLDYKVREKKVRKLLISLIKKGVKEYL